MHTSLQYLFPDSISRLLNGCLERLHDKINEIRFRVGQPISVLIGGKNLFLTAQGEVTSSSGLGQKICATDIQDIFLVACKHSVYAYGDQLRNGFLTLPGGNRMAIAGRVVYDGGKISTIQNISSLSIRIAREKKGCSRELMDRIVHGEQICSCAIISPPGGGKTTLLRDLARAISCARWSVSVIDERGEIAGMDRGNPSYDLGPTCDILDGCRKKEGLMMALRGLSPAVMIVDELGDIEEAQAVLEGIKGGVATVFSLHAADLLQAVQRAPLAYLLEHNAPDCIAVLSGASDPGKITAFYDMRKGENVNCVKNIWMSPS